MKRLFGTLWALPTSLVGLLLAVLGGARPYALRPAWCWHWVPVWGFWKWWYRPFSPWAAITFGSVTILSNGWKDDAVTIRHERVHTLQSWRWGPLFLPVYLFLFMRSGGYRSNPMEAAAYAAERTPDGYG